MPTTPIVLRGCDTELGANFVQLVLSPRFARGPADVAAAWTRQTIWLGERYWNTAGGALAAGTELNPTLARTPGGPAD